MNRVELRWRIWNIPKEGPPPFGAVSIGSGAQQLYQVLEYREKLVDTWTDWKKV